MIWWPTQSHYSDPQSLPNLAHCLVRKLRVYIFKTLVWHNWEPNSRSPDSATTSGDPEHPTDTECKFNSIKNVHFYKSVGWLSWDSNLRRPVCEANRRSYRFCHGVRDVPMKVEWRFLHLKAMAPLWTRHSWVSSRAGHTCNRCGLF